VHTYYEGKGNNARLKTQKRATDDWGLLAVTSATDLKSLAGAGWMSKGTSDEAEAIANLLSDPFNNWDAIHSRMLAWHKAAEGELSGGSTKDIDKVKVKLDIMNDMLVSYIYADENKAKSPVMEYMNGLAIATYTSSADAGIGIPRAVGKPYIHNLTSDSTDPADVVELVQHIASEVGTPIYLHTGRAKLVAIYQKNFNGVVI
jgi:hypothetical protein